MNNALPTSLDLSAPPWSARRIWGGTAAIGLLLYVGTMAPGVLWGDSGDAQIRVLLGQWTDARELARTHVTFYAAAIALRKLLGLDAARAANLTTAVAGAITVANFAWLLSGLVRSRTALIGGIALLLLSHTLWQLATGAEVITFSTMCLTFELTAALRYLKTRQLAWLLLAAGANGFGWATHNFAMLTWPAYAALILGRCRHRPWPRLGPAALGLAVWLLGCLPLLALVIGEYQRVGGMADVVRSLLVGRYSRQVLNTDVSPALAVLVIAYVVMNFPTPLLILAPWGWWRLRSTTNRSGWWLLTIAGLTFAAFGTRYRVPDQYTFLVHSYLFVVVFVAAGIDQWLTGPVGGRRQVVALILSALAPIAYLAAPPVVRRVPFAARLMPGRVMPYRDPYDWFLRPWRAGYGGAERYAREVLAGLPPRAVLLVDEMMRPPLLYLQIKEQLRVDVGVPESRYAVPLARAPEPGDAREAEPLIREGRLFCGSTVPSSLPPWLRIETFRFEPAGLAYRVAFPPAVGADR